MQQTCMKKYVGFILLDLVNSATFFFDSLGWIKFGSIKELIFLGDDAIAMASGIHVFFLNLVTREERIERFDSAERGRGASCLAGHPAVPMFATAERRSHPKIFIFTYPGIRRVSCCSLEKRANRYLSSTFAGTEYLLTLTDFPKFQIILWLWRTGERLTSIDTTIIDHDQRIACSPSSSHLVSQIGIKSGKLIIYEISVCSKIVSIVPVNDATLFTRNTVCASWTSDGNLLYCDSAGNVFLISSDGKKRFLIVRGEDDNFSSKGNPLLENFRTGVILVNEKSQILFYRKPMGSNRIKSGSPWKLVWSVQATSHPTCIVRYPHKDSLLLCGDRGEIFELSIDSEEDSPIIRILFYLGSKYEFLIPLNSLDNHVVAINEHERLDILQCITGQLVGNMCLKSYGQVRCVTSHPTLPIIAIGTTVGKCLLLNLVKISEPSIIKIAYLQKESLDRIRFSWSASVLGVAHISLAKLFIIGDRKKEKNVVLGLLQLSIEIIDFLIYETGEESSRVFLLVKTSKNQICGRKMMIYSFDYPRNIEECERVIELPNMLDSLNYGRKKNEIIVVPYLTKQLHFIEIQEHFQGLNLTQAIATGHQLRNIAVSVNNKFLVTCSYDGLIIVRSKTNVQQVFSIFMSHHRQEGGTKFVIFSDCNNTFVSLGRNGDLAATKICNFEIVLSDNEDLAISNMEESREDIIEDDVTWVERNLVMKLQKESEECAAERSSILQDFMNLKERLKLLLDSNEEQSANIQLPISNFDLDDVTRSRKLHENISKQKALSWKLEEKIFQRDQVAKYLRELCWDSMQIPACSLISINGNTVVDNFPVPRVSKLQQDRCKWEDFDVEFKTSENREKMMIQEEISEGPSILGTMTHRWIPEIPISFSNQIKKFASYTEGRRICTIIRNQERKLKIYFNNRFENMRALKEHELIMAAQRIDEIRHCASELKNTFGIDRSKVDDVSQPLWHYSEKPETIVTVTDDEILSGHAVIFLEREVHLEMMRKREKEGLKLNDEFREGALEVMMDGLLEVRWEDEIKKDLPKPFCLLNKDPSKYTEEEISAVKIYRIKDHELNMQREKYRKLLENKILTVQEALRQDANTFDRKLVIFNLERMKIESAVFQEKLMRLRESQRHSFKRRVMETMRLASKELESEAKEFWNLVEISTTLETVVNDTKNRYENLRKRDRTLEGKFRDEFPDLKQPMVEHLLRQYRKRPRNVQFTCTSVTYLMEIARCLVNNEKSEILPKDCLEFLRGMDSLDIMPNNLPAQIDASHWYLLCKLRRVKVELEIKIKSCAVDLAEAEQTFVSYQKSCSNAEMRLSHLKESMNEHKMENFKALEDMQVQSVLKMGQIESRLCGDSNELSNAILVPFRIVERANNEIIDAGRNKIVAMRKTVEFRRITLWREWRHKCMRLTLQDMKEQLKILQSVKVTKEIQYYLKTYSRHVGMEKVENIYERIVVSTKDRYRRMLQKEKRKLVESSHKVTAWRKQNEKLVDAIERTKLSSFKVTMTANDGTRERDLKHRRMKLKAIVKRTKLIKKVQNNYNELLAMQNQLELLRLKTYPTLRHKSLAKDKATINKTTRK